MKRRHGLSFYEMPSPEAQMGSTLVGGRVVAPPRFPRIVVDARPPCKPIRVECAVFGLPYRIVDAGGFEVAVTPLGPLRGLAEWLRGIGAGSVGVVTGGLNPWLPWFTPLCPRICAYGDDWYAGEWLEEPRLERSGGVPLERVLAHAEARGCNAILIHCEAGEKLLLSSWRLPVELARSTPWGHALLVLSAGYAPTHILGELLREAALGGSVTTRLPVGECGEVCDALRLAGYECSCEGGGAVRVSWRARVEYSYLLLGFFELQPSL